MVKEKGSNDRRHYTGKYSQKSQNFIDGAFFHGPNILIKFITFTFARS